MADRIGSIKFISDTHLGTLRDLGVKRAASVLWKAAWGEKADVMAMFERHAARKEARANVTSAMANETFTTDWGGLSKLHAASRSRSANYPTNATTTLVYKATLFDAAWDSTIGKSKHTLGLWDINNGKLGLDHRTLKSNLSAAFSRGDVETVDRDLEDIARLGYLPHYEVGPGAMKRPPERAGIEHDLEIVDRLPAGVSACEGSNQRNWNPDTGEFQAVPNVVYKTSFTIRPDGDAVALALSKDGIDSCKNANKALFAGDPKPRGTSECLIKRRADGQFDITGARQDERLWVIVPPNKKNPTGGAVPLGKGPNGIYVPSNALIVGLSEAAGRALAMIPKSEQEAALAPATLTRIARSVDPAAALHELVLKLVNRGTHLHIKARETAHVTAEHLAVFKLAERSPKILQHDGMVERINNMLDVAGIPADIRDQYRVSMNQTEHEFVATIGRILKNLDELRTRIHEPFGGDLAIVVMSPRQVLGLAPEHPTKTPTAATESEDEFFNIPLGDEQ
jgi:hypothetical protein